MKKLILILIAISLIGCFNEEASITEYNLIIMTSDESGEEYIKRAPKHGVITSVVINEQIVQTGNTARDVKPGMYRITWQYGYRVYVSDEIRDIRVRTENINIYGDTVVRLGINSIEVDRF